jgi:hypothetical protein
MKAEELGEEEEKTKDKVSQRSFLRAERNGRMAVYFRLKEVKNRTRGSRSTKRRK